MTNMTGELSKVRHAIEASGRSFGTLADHEDEPRELNEEERLTLEALDEVSPFAPGYLEAYLKLGIVSKAAAAAGISAGAPRSWRERSDAFKQVEQQVREEVRERWLAVAVGYATSGFTETMYDAEGNLKHTRVRQDPSFLRATLGAIDPERWGTTDKAGAVTIQIAIVQAPEGKS